MYSDQGHACAVLVQSRYGPCPPSVHASMHAGLRLLRLTRAGCPPLATCAALTQAHAPCGSQACTRLGARTARCAKTPR